MELITCPCCGKRFNPETFEPEFKPVPSEYMSKIYHNVASVSNMPDIANVQPQPAKKLEICITGFSEEDKAKLKAMALKSGLIVRTGVSKELSVLVCGEKPGSAKLAQAKENNVSIINLDQFIKDFLILQS